MGKQIFEIKSEWPGSYGERIIWEREIELDDEVINAVTDEWRSVFYKLKTPQEVAEHIAYNIIVNDARLCDLDGFANLPNEYAEILRE